MLLCLLWLLLASPATQAASPSVRQLIEHGYRLAQKGDLKGAEQELREAVKLAPQDAVALAVLGMVLSSGSNLQEANHYLERALSLDPRDTGTRYNLAVNQARLGKSEEAKSNLRLILKQKPDHKQAEGLLASLEPKSGYDAALGKYRAGDFKGSQGLLEQAIAAGNRDAKTLSLLAWCHHRQGRTEDSLIAMKQAIELAPSDCSLYSQTGHILLEVRNYPAASGAVAKALSLSPSYVPALKLKGLLSIERGDLKLAEKIFEKAVQLDPMDPEALERLGMVQGWLFQYSEATRTFEKCMTKFPSYARLYESYGRMLLDSGTNYDLTVESRAALLFEKAIKLDPALPHAHYELGKNMLQHGRMEEGLVHLETAAKLDQRDSSTHLILANAYRLLGRPEDQARELKIYKELEAEKGQQRF